MGRWTRKSNELISSMLHAIRPSFEVDHYATAEAKSARLFCGIALGHPLTDGN